MAFESYDDEEDHFDEYAEPYQEDNPEEEEEPEEEELEEEEPDEEQGGNMPGIFRTIQPNDTFTSAVNFGLVFTSQINDLNRVQIGGLWAYRLYVHVLTVQQSMFVYVEENRLRNALAAIREPMLPRSAIQIRANGPMLLYNIPRIQHLQNFQPRVRMTVLNENNVFEIQSFISETPNDIFLRYGFLNIGIGSIHEPELQRSGLDLNNILNFEQRQQRRTAAAAATATATAEQTVAIEQQQTEQSLQQHQQPTITRNLRPRTKNVDYNDTVKRQRRQ